MATFRVGQRVRIVNATSAQNPEFRKCNGNEVVIIGLPGYYPFEPTYYAITKPAGAPVSRAGYGAEEAYLAPLTDPKADEFIARLEKLGREPAIGPDNTIRIQLPVEVRK